MAIACLAHFLLVPLRLRLSVTPPKIRNVEGNSMQQAMTRSALVYAGLIAFTIANSSASAAPFSFSTGTPDGLIGTLSRPLGAGHIQTETADDFTLSAAT